ncbi:glycosyltransferase [Mangrovimonas sp. YM274]|uniref:glycosyltransferase family 2 protein n=1 Tax=Mangrovimonas sp. YM274 TaxID=3070660 RepID=UPI0027DD32D0|nr:glycosyltransferase [Mangrovimonas sp. YM274]WMI69842.1 glycosyltransferase [Mangrovimonas sp. YM274]
MKPLVSVIVPNYNHLKFLKQRLESIFNQTYQNFEVILLDDCSSDKSVDFLKNYKSHPRVSHLVVNRKNSESPFKQWQKGISIAKGKFIWIAESDDYCELTFLEKTIEQLMSGARICYTQTMDVNEDGRLHLHRKEYTRNLVPNIWLNDFKIEGNKLIRDYLVIKNIIPNASAVVFDKSLITTNTFDRDLLSMRMCGDWLFWLKICKNTEIAFVHEPLNYFRGHENTSRFHRTNKEKQQRLLEEAEIRNYIYREWGLTLKKLENELYLNWFKLNKFKYILKSNFYRIRIKPTHKIELLIYFLKYRLLKSYKAEI